MNVFKDKKFVFLLISVIIVIVLEVFSIMGKGIPMPYAPFVFAAFILAIGWKVLWEGLKALFTLKFSSINMLMLIAVCAAFYLEQYSEAAVVIVLYVLGEKLEDIGIEKSKSALNRLVSATPKTAVMKETGEEMPVENVPVGTIIIVKPHDMIPLDGKIVLGETAVDEASITGEPIPKEKIIGDLVFAGTLNQNGYIEVCTTKNATDTTFSKILALTFEAQENKSENQKTIQKFAKYYTPSIIILSVLLFVIPVFVLNKDFNSWLLQAISLLVIACPCALVISTPVAIYAAIGNASSRGALVKGGKFIEAMAKIKVLALDKTRTITYGTPMVSDVIPLNGTSREELLACAAGTELFSEHPIAQAIVKASRDENFEPHRSEKFRSIAGKGATARCLVCDHADVLIGQLHFIGEYCDISDEVQQIVLRLSEEGKTSVVVSFGDGVAGIIGLTDTIKPDSQVALEEVEALKIMPVMLSGDSQKAALYIAEQVGIKTVYGGLLPDEKALKIKELNKKYGDVAMVGDGINDAPALAGATVGIAMGAVGSDTAIETADIALMNDHLTLIPFLVRLGRATVNRIKWNILFAIFIKLIFIILAFLGHANLVFAIAADVGVTLIVIFLSLFLINYEKK